MICLIGGKGSIGSRYAAIMKWNKIPHVIYDIDTPEIDLFSYEKYIIATPTETHVKFLEELKGKKILCEKPVCKNPSEIPDMNNAYVVNNWLYVTRLMQLEGPFMIEYDFYRTGRDGLLWDCCQLLYLDPEAILNKRSPKWNVTINGKPVAYRTLEDSYNRMILDFHNSKYENLWTLQQGKEMTEVVLERLKRESFGKR